METRDRIWELEQAFLDGRASAAEIEELRELLADEDPDYRQEALHALGEAGMEDDELTDEVVDVMLAYCLDHPKDVRKAAAYNLRLLGRTRSETVIRPAIETRQERLEDESVREGWSRSRQPPVARSARVTRVSS